MWWGVSRKEERGRAPNVFFCGKKKVQMNPFRPTNMIIGGAKGEIEVLWFFQKGVMVRLE